MNNANNFIYFAFACPANNSTNCIDHFIVNGAIVNLITSYHRLHNADNAENALFHSILSLKIGVNVSYKFRPGPNWSCSTQKIFRNVAKHEDLSWAQDQSRGTLHTA